MRYGTLVLGLIGFEGIVSEMTAVKTSRHSVQNELTSSCVMVEVVRHWRVALALSKSALLYNQTFRCFVL